LSDQIPNDSTVPPASLVDVEQSVMERQLVEGAQHGDRAAFEALASDAIDRLYGIAALILHDGDSADDAVQETLIQAWRDLPRLRDPERFESWLHSVLIHRCVDLARRRHLQTGLPRWLADRTDVESEVVDRDRVQRGLLRLTPRERSALVLRYFLGLSVPQLAEALRLPLGTAKSRLHAAESAMRAAIDADSRLVLKGGLP
jgi:RNA polymerase sigma-70 factor (ECF subfamily)